MRYFLTIPLLLLMVFTFSSCRDLKEPEFRSVDNFGLRKLGLQEAEIGFEVTYFNPNNVGVSVKEAEADIYLDSVFVGKFMQERQVEVSKNADFSIPFRGSISLQRALQMNLSNLANKQVLLKAEGSARVGKGGIYVTRPISYQGWHRLEDINIR